MMELEPLIDRIVNLPPEWLYAILFLGSIVESLIPFYPSDVITLYCAFLAGRGSLSSWTVYSLAAAGSYIGVMGVYGVGVAMGRGLFRRRRFLFFTPDRIGEVERWLNRYGVGALLISRFLPGVRALLAPAAGLVGLSGLRVGVFALCSVLLWNGALMALGFLAGANWERARALLKGYNVSMLTLLIIMAVGWTALIVYRKVRS